MRCPALLLAAVLVGCASAPPVKPIGDVKSVVGVWQGFLTTKDVRDPLILTIREDGSYAAATSLGGGMSGTLRIHEGKLVLQPAQGRGGTLTLHEGKGKRMLRGLRDDGAATLELRE
ncbi:MAG: hypothetical protein HY727_07655 [Candidatus Rokubacteria bacterium]|nr:hypothetical protein [Candidatus Rokubacteria bacterium]